MMNFPRLYKFSTLTQQVPSSEDFFLTSHAKGFERWILYYMGRHKYKIFIDELRLAFQLTKSLKSWCVIQFWKKLRFIPQKILPFLL